MSSRTPQQWIEWGRQVISHFGLSPTRERDTFQGTGPQVMAFVVWFLPHSKLVNGFFILKKEKSLAFKVDKGDNATLSKLHVVWDSRIGDALYAGMHLRERMKAQQQNAEDAKLPDPVLPRKTMTSSFVTRAASARIIDFRDPDNLPGMTELMHNAYSALEKRCLESGPRWNLVIDKVKATDVYNKKSADWNAKWLISFRFKGGSVTMFRDDVMLCSDVFLSDNIDGVLIKELWKKSGIELYPMDFSTMGSNRLPGMFNSIKIGYYSSLDNKAGDKRVKAILKTISYIQKRKT